MARHDYGIWSRCSSFARFAPPRSPLSVPRAGGANSIVLHEAKRARPPRHAARGRGVPTRLLEHDVRPCVKQNNLFLLPPTAPPALPAQHFLPPRGTRPSTGPLTHAGRVVRTRTVVELFDMPRNPVFLLFLLSLLRTDVSGDVATADNAPGCVAGTPLHFVYEDPW